LSQADKRRATIIDYLQNAFPNPDISIAFIYCNYKEQEEQTVISLIASLLRQLVERRSSVPNEVQKLYKHHNSLRTRPSLTEYSQLLQLIVARSSKVFLIIDALDECNESNGTRSSLITEIQKLPPCMHLLCTSRHAPDIEQQFSGLPRQEIRASNIDVERYLVDSIKKNARLKKHVLADASLLDAIIGSIVARVDGMLLCQNTLFYNRKLINFLGSFWPNCISSP
jgi:hypothetical protein